MKKLFVLAVALVVLGSAWLLARDTSAHDASAPPVSSSPHSPAHERAADSPSGNATSSAISGTIRESIGAPLQDATVCAIDPTAPHAPQRCASSKADGTYALLDLPGNSYEVVASAPHHMPGRWRHDGDGRITLRRGEHRTAIDVTLDEGGVEVHGRVGDIGGGAIAAAEIVLATEATDHRILSVVARGSDDGSFVAWVMPGVIVATAHADGYAAGQTIGRAPGGFLTIQLTPEARLSGVVVDATTRVPIANAEVIVSESGGLLVEGHEIALGTSTRATTDQAGRFVLPGLAPGRYRPSARRDGLVGEAARSVLLGLGQSIDDLVIEVRRAPIVSARVTGRVCVALSATLEEQRANPAAPRTTAYRAESTDGTLELAGVAPGRYNVSVTCDGVEDRHNPSIEVGDRDIEVEWRIDPGTSKITIVGEVRDPRGGAVIGARVVAYTTDDREISETTSRSGGQFALALSPGHFTIAAVSDAGAPLARSVVDITDRVPPPIVLAIARVTRLTGTVRDPMGHPVGGRIVHLVVRDRPGAPNRDVPTADDGTFEIAGVPAGHYAIFATTSVMAWEPPRTQELSLSGEPRREVIVEAAQQVGTISGIVQDAMAAPIGDAYVVVAPEHDGETALHAADRPMVLTDGSGGFMIDHLGAGPFTVLAMRKGGGMGRLEHVAVGAHVAVHISAAGSVHGSVVTAAGRAAERFVVTAYDAAKDFYVRETFTGGRFTIDGVPATALHLFVTGPDGDGEADVAVLADRTVTARVILAVRPRVSGRVIDAASGRPVPGAEVAITRTDGDSPIMGLPGAHVSDALGRFEVRESPVGAVSVYVSPPKGWQGQSLQRTFASGQLIDLGDIQLTPER